MHLTPSGGVFLKLRQTLDIMNQVRLVSFTNKHKILQEGKLYGNGLR